MNFSKFSYALKRDGIIGFINVFFGKIGIKFRFKTLIFKRIKYLEKQLKIITRNLVQSGPYKNLKITNDVNWSDQDFNAKILGIYEEEVQKKLTEWNLKNFINLGGAEGYHGLGQLISKTKLKSYIFEQDKISREILKKNARLNNLEGNIKIFEKAENNFLEILKKLNINFKESCFLIDIEGDEYNLLNEIILDELKNSRLIIELHFDKKNQNNLLLVLKKYFNIEILTTTKRDLSDFHFLKDFNDIDRWLLVSENRPAMMRWAVCSPK
tara:strand:- start:203 stop:1009 length:807 start_codon:yes stop_codon:yes gene_type:complete